MVRQDMERGTAGHERGMAGHGTWYGRTWNVVRQDMEYGTAGQGLFLRPELQTESEEQTSEIQSRPHHSYSAFCLKKKKENKPVNNEHIQQTK